MAVEAVHNNGQNKTSYINSLAVGVMGGYALKWALPILPSENDKRYTDELNSIKKRATGVWEQEIEAIRIEGARNQGADEFIKMYDDLKEKNPKVKSMKYLFTEEIKKFEAPSQLDLMSLLNRANNAYSNTKEKDIDGLKLNTKSIRPTGTFMTIGAFITLGIALFNNITKEVSNKKNLSINA